MTFRFLSATKSQLAEHIPSWHPSVTGELNPKSEIPKKTMPVMTIYTVYFRFWNVSPWIFLWVFLWAITRCWQLKYFFWIFIPNIWGRCSPTHFHGLHYFSNGLNRNHQPVGASNQLGPWARYFIAAVLQQTKTIRFPDFKSCGDSSLTSRSPTVGWNPEMPEKQATKMYILIVELCRNKMYIYI